MDRGRYRGMGDEWRSVKEKELEEGDFWLWHKGHSWKLQWKKDEDLRNFAWSEERVFKHKNICVLLSPLNHSVSSLTYELFSLFPLETWNVAYKWPDKGKLKAFNSVWFWFDAKQRGSPHLCIKGKVHPKWKTYENVLTLRPSQM